MPPPPLGASERALLEPLFLPSLAFLVLFSLGLLGCGGVASMPALLTTTVHRTEEQGIDYSSSGTSTLEITLAGDGSGRAVRATRATDVLDTDAHTTDDTASYDVVAHRVGDGLSLVLTPVPGESPLTSRVELACEPWTSASRAERGDAADLALPGVEWVCELRGERVFALGRVVIQHVPREGNFLLFATSNQLVVREEVTGSARTVSTRQGPPRR